MPVIQRLDEYHPSTNSYTMTLVGNPNMLRVSNNISASDLYATLDRLLPCEDQYTIILTDGQVSLFNTLLY